MSNVAKLNRDPWVEKAVDVMVDFCKPITRKTIHHSRRRDLQMGGHGRYKPADLQPLLGYDNFVMYLIIVEWAWLKTLNRLGVIPKSEAVLLRNDKILHSMLKGITTTDQDEEEINTKHDIIALTNLMKAHDSMEKFPEPLRKWVHYCATSYDIISTAYALQFRVVVDRVMLPKMRTVDGLWREVVEEHAETLQAGRTHLQTALPVTVGFWLANLHNRYVRNCRSAAHYANMVEGKFSGACGTSASQIAMIGNSSGEEIVLSILGLVPAPISTQIAPPESLQSAYHSLVQLSGCLGNLGEDGRILQMSVLQELRSSSSTSSAMSHKTSNPIASEQLMGMHRTVISKFTLILMNMVSDLQRDLTGSSCMREYSEILVLVYQQLNTAERWFSNLKVDKKRCRANLAIEERFLTAEILHLSLAKAGLPDAHHFVNDNIIKLTIEPICMTLGQAMEKHISWLEDCDDESLKIVRDAWSGVPDNVREVLHNPSTYIGNAAKLAIAEVGNIL